MNTLMGFTKKAMEFWRARFGPIESNTRRTATATEATAVSVANLDAGRGGAGAIEVEGIVGGEPVAVTGTITSAAEYAEDSVHVSGDTGVHVLAVRHDANSALAADGDYHPLELNNRGDLKVDIGASATVSVTGGPLGVFDTPVFTSDVYTAAADGASNSINVTSTKFFSMQVVPTGVVTSWDVRLELSLDGNTWTEVMAHTNVSPGSGGTVFVVSPCLAASMRTRCDSIVLGGGTNITVYLMGGA